MLPSPDGGARFGSVGWVFRLGAVQGRPLRLMQVPLTGASVQISEQLGLWIASTAPLARPRTTPLAVPATGPLPLAVACLPRVLALTAGAAATRAARVTPATASRVRARHPVRVMNIRISLHS